MSGLALTHPQNMRLSSPQHPNGTLSAQMLATHRHTPPNQMQLPAQSQTLPPIAPISSPQNLTTTQAINSRSNNVRIPPSASISPENLSNSNDKLMTTTSSSSTNQFDDSIGDLPSNNKDIAMNTDVRTNSIATLRIKAKEHLESINKGLAMA